MAKEVQNFTVKMGSGLNRFLGLQAFPSGKGIPFAIIYNKQSPGLQFQVDYNAPVVADGTIQINMTRDLSKCKFCQTFFNLQSCHTETLDVQNKFNGANSTFTNNLFHFATEQLDLTCNSKNKRPGNYLLILGWKIHGFEEDLIYYFVQRRCYDITARVGVIRTAGIQFATRRGLEVLDKYYNKSLSGYKSGVSVDFLHDQRQADKLESLWSDESGNIEDNVEYEDIDDDRERD